MAEVIANGGYHVAVDAGGIGGKHESSFGVEESATVARMLAWVDETRGRPFFLTYMPVAGHHPYDAPEPGPFDSRRVIGSYRNAIHAADRSIGTLVAGLRARGLWEHTVFVVVGDHGQAFGQHPDNFGHTFFLYEENVHVPFLIAAPGLVTRALRVCQVTSHVDVAPTILGLVGVNPPRGYEGFDMLRPRRALALMFTDYAEAFVGLRDGRFKFIHHVEAGTSALFDLIADPGELHDIASSHGARVAAYRERALAWAASRRGAVMSW
jgi:arylsulfatase A-like enzyme